MRCVLHTDSMFKVKLKVFVGKNSTNMWLSMCAMLRVLTLCFAAFLQGRGAGGKCHHPKNGWSDLTILIFTTHIYTTYFDFHYT